MPVNDWQFWVVTLAAIASLYLLKVVLLPKKKGTRTTLTVGGQPVGKQKKHKSKDCNCG